MSAMFIMCALAAGCEPAKPSRRPPKIAPRRSACLLICQDLPSRTCRGVPPIGPALKQRQIEFREVRELELRAMVKMAMAVVLLTVCALAVYVNAVTDTGSGFPVPSYYVLGDAYLDAGNNNHIKNKVPKANVKPYGMTWFKGVPTGRFCDGRIFSDMLAKIMKLPMAPPSLPNVTIDQKGQCVNYASGGSAILHSSCVAYGTRNALNFEKQVSLFESHAVDVIYEFGVDEALLILMDAIYPVNFGTIDILAYFTNPTFAAAQGPIQKFLDSLAKEYRWLVDRLYTSKARKIVVFGVGPLQRYPLVRLLTSKMTSADAKKFVGSIDAAVRQLNSQLRLMITELNADSGLDQEHASLQIVFADVYRAVTHMSKNPAAYGLTDVRNACCGGGKYRAEIKCGAKGYKVCSTVSKSLYWNDMQFTEAANRALFKLFFDGSSFVKPFSVKHLAKMLIPGVPY